MEFIKWKYQCDHLLVTQSICWSLNGTSGQTKLILMCIDQVIYSTRFTVSQKKKDNFLVLLKQRNESNIGQVR